MGPEPLLPSHDLPQRIERALQVIRSRSATAPAVAITLGSGLGALADALEDPVTIPAATIPEWPPSTVAGHSGRLVMGRWQGVPLVLLAGRSHRYEGYSVERVTFGARVMHALGAGTMIFTNAVGAVNPDLAPGDLVLATDHINAIGKRGLFTPAELGARRTGRRVARFYDAALAAELATAALSAGVPLRHGVLMGGHGPSYETRAEIRMAQAIGADMVCMSTVHEVTVAAHLGCRVAGLSCVTNRATGLAPHPLTHEEVTTVAHQAAGRLAALLGGWLATTARGPEGS
jgi:purine-nucleoside phosphorylase